MNRKLIRLLAFALSLSLLACGRDARDPAAGITVWSSNNPGEIALAEWAVASFSESGQAASTQPVPEGQSSEEVVLAAVVGGTTPDVYANMWQGSVAMYAEAGVLVALDTLDGFTDWLAARCSPETIAEVTAPDGHVYQVPWKVNPIVTMYNRALFPAGAPATYDDFLAAGARLSRDADGDGYVDTYVGYTSPRTIWYERLFNFYPLYLAATGGAPLVEDGRVAFDRPEAVAVMSFLRQLYARGYMTRDQLSASGDPFLSGRVATNWTGPWSVDYVDRYAPEGFAYDFAPMLAPERSDVADPPYTYGDPKNIVVFATAPNPQAAWDFLAATLLSDEGDLRLLRESGQLPRRRDLLTDPRFAEYFATRPAMRAFAKQAQRVRGVSYEPRIVEVLDVISQEYEACVLFDVKTPGAAIRDAAAAARVLLGQTDPS